MEKVQNGNDVVYSIQFFYFKITWTLARTNKHLRTDQSECEGETKDTNDFRNVEISL